MFTAKYRKGDIVGFTQNGSYYEGFIFSTNVKMLEESKNVNAIATFTYRIRVIDKFYNGRFFDDVSEDSIIKWL